VTTSLFAAYSEQYCCGTNSIIGLGKSRGSQR
jgi:hypothetical protein